MLAGSKATSEKMQKEFAQLNDRVSKLQTDLEEQIHQNTELLAENGQKQLLIKSKDEEIAGVRAETAQVTKLRDQTVKKLKALEDAKADTESQRDTLKQGARSCCPHRVMPSGTPTPKLLEPALPVCAKFVARSPRSSAKPKPCHGSFHLARRAIQACAADSRIGS